MKKKLAIDVFYKENSARAVGIIFDNWEDEKPSDTIVIDYTGEINEYEPGSFYKRELPFIHMILEECSTKGINTEDFDYIIVDGHVFLYESDGTNYQGLGCHLYESLGMKIPVIGVAKSSYKAGALFDELVYRGESKNPLYVTSVGVDKDDAGDFIRSMHGEYRIPTLLKLLDQITKENGKG